MINKIIIDGFKGLTHAEYDLGQDTIITGRNGAGKSRIIEAIVYCLTGEVNGYKKKINKCSVALIGNGINVSRVNGKFSIKEYENGHDKKLLCGIMPGYIHSLTTREKIKTLLGFDIESDMLPFNTHGFYNYKKFNEAVSNRKKYSKLIEEYGKEIYSNLEIIESLGDNNVGNLTEIKSRYDLIIKYKEIVYQNESIQKHNEDMQIKIKEIKKELKGFDQDINLHFIKNGFVDKINKYETNQRHLMFLNERLEKLSNGLCYTCSQSVQDDILIKEVKKEIELTKEENSLIEITKLRKELKNIDKSIFKYEEQLRLKLELDRTEASIKTLIELPDIVFDDTELEDLTIKLSNFEELFSKQNKRQLLLDRNIELGKKINSINDITTNNNIDLFKLEEKKYFKDSEKNFSNGFKLILYKNNETNDNGQLVFEIEKDGIDYFWLSSAQKLLVDTEISLIISKHINTDYILVDNGERLTEANTKKLMEMIGSKQIILTKVSQGDLNLEID